jgi:hypothetical protein
MQADFPAVLDVCVLANPGASRNPDFATMALGRFFLGTFGPRRLPFRVKSG